MDLQKLSRQSESDAPPRVPQPKRKWVTRVGLPAAIVLATLLLLLYAARDLILPATPVQTVTAVAVTASIADQSDGSNNTSPQRDQVVAQAPGWVEPDPYPIYASALANGVVETVHVLEGETVTTGQVLVELIKDDAHLALSTARAELAESEAALVAAKVNLDEPIALSRAEAVSRAQIDAKKAALIQLEAEIEKEQARLDELQAAYKRLNQLSKQSVSKLSIEEAKFRAQSQRAALEATKQRRPEIAAELTQAKAEHTAAKRDLELKTGLKRIHDQALAARDAAKTRVQEAELRLERMTIKSSMNGLVMARLVGPGSKVMFDMESPHSAHVIHLYDPGSLQVRVDVPLADASRVGMGQRAAIVVDVLPDIEFTGEVTRLVHRADIAKNTVQFKVAITDPSPLLKPDMLARVKFYQGARNASAVDDIPTSHASHSPVALQQSAVIDDESGTWVWWVSPVDQRIERRKVVLGKPRADGVVEVVRGLNPGDVLIDQPKQNLQEHQRVKVEN